jgi:hypothetical protein
VSDNRSSEERDCDAFSAHDLITSGWKPKASDIAAAPFIDAWELSHVGYDSVLVGEVTGHPRLKDGRITTSALLGLDPVGGWAWTYRGIYRLGARYVPTDAERDILDVPMAWPKPNIPGSGKDMEDEIPEDLKP